MLCVSCLLCINIVLLLLMLLRNCLFAPVRGDALGTVRGRAERAVPWVLHPVVRVAPQARQGPGQGYGLRHAGMYAVILYLCCATGHSAMFTHTTALLFP